MHKYETTVFTTSGEEIAALRALVIEFIDATGWTMQRNLRLRNARRRATELVPEIVGNPPDKWEEILAKAKALRPAYADENED